MPQRLFLHGFGEPFSLHSKYLMEGNNLPSPSLSITRRWGSRQMCPETIILYRLFLANFILSLNITECKGPMPGHDEKSVSFNSKLQFMLPYDSLPFKHESTGHTLLVAMTYKLLNARLFSCTSVVATRSHRFWHHMHSIFAVLLKT